jgi:hypothetical protein
MPGDLETVCGRKFWDAFLYNEGKSLYGVVSEQTFEIKTNKIGRKRMDRRAGIGTPLLLRWNYSISIDMKTHKLEQAHAVFKLIQPPYETVDRRSFPSRRGKNCSRRVNLSSSIVEKLPHPFLSTWQYESRCQLIYFSI